MSKERKLTALDRLILRSIGRDMTMADADDPAQSKWPLLWDWLTRCEAGKDHLKEPAKLVVRAVPGGWALALQDIDLNVALEAHSGLLEAIFDALEASLNGPVVPIKKYGRTTKHLRKRNTGS